MSAYEKAIPDVGRLTQIASGDRLSLSAQLLDESLVLWDHSIDSALYGSDVRGTFTKMQTTVDAITALN